MKRQVYRRYEITTWAVIQPAFTTFQPTIFSASPGKNACFQKNEPLFLTLNRQKKCGPPGWAARFGWNVLKLGRWSWRVIRNLGFEGVSIRPPSNLLDRAKPQKVSHKVSRSKKWIWPEQHNTVPAKFKMKIKKVVGNSMNSAEKCQDMCRLIRLSFH